MIGRSRKRLEKTKTGVNHVQHGCQENVRRDIAEKRDDSIFRWTNPQTAQENEGGKERKRKEKNINEKREGIIEKDIADVKY